MKDRGSADKTDPENLQRRIWTKQSAGWSHRLHFPGCTRILRLLPTADCPAATAQNEDKVTYDPVHPKCFIQ